jgi:hypothetical protein
MGGTSLQPEMRWPNLCNPSTKRLLAVEVKEMWGNEAVVRTTE